MAFCPWGTGFIERTREFDLFQAHVGGATRMLGGYRSEGTGLEGGIYAGLETLTSDLLGREWMRDDGAAM